jgi:hypothetical protein
MRAASIKEEVFCEQILSWDQRKALNGDFCAGSRTFFCRQEDYGDFIKSMGCRSWWDGKSQYFFHRWTVQGNLPSLAG